MTTLLWQCDRASLKQQGLWFAPGQQWEFTKCLSEKRETTRWWQGLDTLMHKSNLSHLICGNRRSTMAQVIQNCIDVMRGMCHNTQCMTLIGLQLCSLIYSTESPWLPHPSSKATTVGLWAAELDLGPVEKPGLVPFLFTWVVVYVCSIYKRKRWYQDAL